jgi:hypothetical protein
MSFPKRTNMGKKEFVLNIGKLLEPLSDIQALTSQYKKGNSKHAKARELRFLAKQKKKRK